MQTQVTGTLNGGTVRLDCPIDIPNNSRVQLSIEVIQAAKTNSNEKIEAWVKILEANPINSGGLKFTREQLYDCD